MIDLRSGLARIVGALSRRRHEQQLDDEIETHLALLSQEYEARGLSSGDARRAARRAFGGVVQTKEAWRDERRLPFVSAAWQDLRYSVRVLAHSPSFFTAAVMTVALSVAVSTVVFRVGHSLFIKPLPYEEPESLVTLAARIPNLPPDYPTIPIRAKDFIRFQQSNVGLVQMAAVGAAEFTLTGEGEPELLHGARVSAMLFPLLGVQPQLGRTFRPDEDATGRDDVVVVSHEVWVSRLGGRRDILDRPVTLNGRPYTIVGVLPPETLFPSGKQLHPLVGLGPRVDVWRPMAFSPSQISNEGSWNYAIIGRLAPGVGATQAQSALNTVAASISSELRSRVPGLDFELTVLVEPLRNVFSRTGREGLTTIAVAAALLCFIACMNLAHLWLGRVVERERELAVRASLGASTPTIVRQLFAEAGMLAVGGVLVGVALAQAATLALVALGPADLTSMGVGRLDAVGIVFAASAGLVIALVAAAGPVVLAARRAAGRAVAGRYVGRGVRQSRTRRLLVAAETALCTGMLGVAGLLLHSLANVWAVDRGFVADQVLAVDLALPVQPYADGRIVPFYAELADRLRALPGVRSAGATSAVPLVSEESTTALYLESDERNTLDKPLALQRGITPGYFDTMEIPLVAGRAFVEREPEAVVILSDLLTRQLWPSDPPQLAIGRRIRIGEVEGQLRTVVGVAGDVRDGALDRRSLPAIYHPHAQFPSRTMTVVLRTSGQPAAISAAIRAELRRLDANLPIIRIRPMVDVVAASVAPRRFQSLIVAILSALALALACVGVYGASSYAVSSGVKEVGVRVALGANPRAVLALVFFQGFWPVLAGVAVGLGLAPAASSLVQHLLFQVGPLDPLALGAVCLILSAIAALVCYLPARRAARIDPVAALRRE